MDESFTKRSCIKKIDEVNFNAMPNLNDHFTFYTLFMFETMFTFGFVFVETECNFICKTSHWFHAIYFSLQSKSSPSTLSSMAAWLEFSLAPYRPCSWLSATTNPHTRTGLHPQVTNQIGWCWRYYMPKSVQRLGSVNESPNWRDTEWTICTLTLKVVLTGTIFDKYHMRQCCENVVV